MLLRGLKKWCFHRAHSKTKGTSFNSTTADCANLLMGSCKCNKLHLESNIVFPCPTVAELLTGRSVLLSWNSLSELLCQLWMMEAVRSDWATGSPPWFLTVLDQNVILSRSQLKTYIISLCKERKMMSMWLKVYWWLRRNFFKKWVNVSAFNWKFN